MNIRIDIEDATYFKAENILDNIGLDVSSFVKMCLKKLTKVNNITFLLDDITMNNKNIPNKREVNSVETRDKYGKMTKSKAAALLRNKGYNVYKNLTFASKNTTTDYFWANPRIDALDSNWSIILNDWREHRLYLFEIKQGEILDRDLVPRVDKKDFIDLQILADDSTFTDRRSGASFIKYLVAKVEY